MRSILFLFILTITTVGYNQEETGNLRLTVDADLVFIHKIEAHLYQADSMVYNVPVNNYDNTMYGIKPGEYSLYFYIDDTLTSIEKGIIIKPGQSTNFYYYNHQEWVPFSDSLDVEYDAEFNSSFSFGLPDKLNNPMVSGEYKISQGVTSFAYSNRYFAVGSINGYNVGYTSFYKNQNPFGLDNIKRQRYFSLELHTGVLLRLSALKKGDLFNVGPVLDFGLLYNLPLPFRHVYVQDNQKVITKKIHNYKDFSVICRVGYLPVTVIAEYRLSNYVKNGMPQLPRLKVGICYPISMSTSDY